MHRSILRSLRVLPPALLAFVATELPATNALASDPFLSIPDPAMVAKTAAYRYANMTNDEALAECTRRNLPFVTVDPVAGVRAPIRLTGRLHGVSIHSNATPNQRQTSPFEILDARLALALDDFTAILEKHDIDEIEHFSMYRPGATAKAAKTPAAPPVAGVVVPAKPNEVDVKPEIDKPAPVTTHVALPVQDKPTANAKIVEMPTANAKATEKPVTNKIVARKKPLAPRSGVAKKSPAKQNPIDKPGSPPVTQGKTALPSKEKPAAPPLQKSPTKPLPKHLGKAELPGKTSAVAQEKGIKHKEPGDVEEVQQDKPTDVVLEAPKQAVSPAPTIVATAPAGETRHPGGLAIDVGKLRKKDGTWISVSQHFHGKIGDKACGPDAPVPEHAEAKELRALVCDAMGDHIFTYVLTPNYNAAHYDHFHMEIKPGVKWFLVH